MEFSGVLTAPGKDDNCGSHIQVAQFLISLEEEGFQKERKPPLTSVAVECHQSHPPSGYKDAIVLF